MVFYIGSWRGWVSFFFFRVGVGVRVYIPNTPTRFGGGVDEWEEGGCAFVIANASSRSAVAAHECAALSRTPGDSAAALQPEQE
jgi:hypothetical protein